MFNFSELKEKVAILVQRSGDTNYIAKIGIWLNLGIQFLENVYDYYNELQGIYNFTTVDGTESYPMPNSFLKPFRIIDLTNKKNMEIISEEEYIDRNLSSIADATEAKPTIARIYGISGTRAQVSTSGKTLKVKSSSTGDTAGAVVRIRGYVDSARLIEDYENITISTTSPTTYVAGTKTFYEITHVSKSADTTGYVTVADADGIVLEYLDPTDRVARHKVCKLGLIPDDAYSMRVYHKKKATIMVNDNDYPFTECDDFLILDSWGWSLNQEKESVEFSMRIWAKAKKALNAILIREAGKLGPHHQHRIESLWLASHRR